MARCVARPYGKIEPLESLDDVRDEINMFVYHLNLMEKNYDCPEFVEEQYKFMCKRFRLIKDFYQKKFVPEV